MIAPHADCTVRLDALRCALGARGARDTAIGSRLDREDRAARELVALLAMLQEARAALAKS